ncbi:MAG: ABC transporter permease [Thermoleophilia bacterium]|nr:ABC transporter permease [Thermoleophilia bacterium]
MTAAPEALARPGRLRAAQQFLADNPVIVLVGVLAVLFIVTDIVNRRDIGEPFITWNQLSTTLLVAAPLGMIAAGQTLVMLTGGIDLSVALTATAAAFATSWQGGNGEVQGVAAGLAVGLGIGLVNGIGVGIFRVNPLIMTLGTSSVTFGLLSIYAGKPFEKIVPEIVSTLGSDRFFDYLPANLLLWVAVAAILILGLRYTGYGRMLYAVGDNPVAARLAGVRLWQVRVVVYALCGVFSALGGLLLVGFTANPDLGLATPYLLQSVAAVVIGGTSIFGGWGGYSGTIVGVLILTVLGSLLTLLDAEEWQRQVIYGSIIIVLTAIYARVSGTD